MAKSTKAIREKLAKLEEERRKLLELEKEIEKENEAAVGKKFIKLYKGGKLPEELAAIVAKILGDGVEEE